MQPELPGLGHIPEEVKLPPRAGPESSTPRWGGKNLLSKHVTDDMQPPQFQPIEEDEASSQARELATMQMQAQERYAARDATQRARHAESESQRQKPVQ